MEGEKPATRQRMAICLLTACLTQGDNLNYIASLDEAKAEAYRVSSLLGVIIVVCGVHNAALETSTNCDQPLGLH